MNKDIQVTGVGQLTLGFEEVKNFEWKENIEEVTGEFNYVFDFEGDKQIWQRLTADKFTLISVNN